MCFFMGLQMASDFPLLSPECLGQEVSAYNAYTQNCVLVWSLSSFGECWLAFCLHSVFPNLTSAGGMSSVRRDMRGVAWQTWVHDHVTLIAPWIKHEV